MGQTWAVVAIGVSIGIAVLLLLWSRSPSKPPEKLPAKPAAKKEAKPGTASEGDAKTEKGDAKAEKGAAKADKGDAKADKGDATADKGDAKADKPDAKADKGDAKADKGDAKAGKTRERMRVATVREPAIERARGPATVEKMYADEEDDDITIVTLTPRADLMAAAAGELPDASGEDEGDEERAPPDSGRAAAVPIIYDAEAAEDEPTRAHAVILVAAVGQTDMGQKRKINEDRYLALDDHNLYVVADGMGGHAGGEVASQLAVDIIETAFKDQQFEGTPYENVPKRGSELALAIQMANRAIYERAKREPKLLGMGTTIVSARFTPGKERVYIGHVGDSRCYRFRAGQLTQLTTDHTMGAIGMTGPFADHLSRAVGIAPAVKVDMVIAKPRHDDIFLLCSDGLSKMVKDDGMREILAAHNDPNEAVKALVQRANEKGGRDNITVIIIVVKDPQGFVRYAQHQQQKKKAEAEAASAEAASPEAKPEAKSDKSAEVAVDVKPVVAIGDSRQSSSVAAADSRQSGRVSVPDVKQGRPSVPDARQSGRVTVPDARQSASVGAQGRTTQPGIKPNDEPPPSIRVEEAPDSSASESKK